MKKNSTKRTLIMSLLSMVLCMSMLIGTTFAWFTDEVTSNGNRIQAGTLEVDLLMDKEENGTYTSIANGNGDIFSEATGNGILWEPGKTEIVYLAVKNTGSLDLKYNILLNIIDGGLIGSLEYAVLDGKKAADLTEVNDWATIKAAAQTGDIVVGQTVAAPNGALKAEENENTDYFALAVHMKEEAGNEYQGKNITIDVLVQAAQLSSEEDSFGNTYDANAEFGTVGKLPKANVVNKPEHENVELPWRTDFAYKPDPAIDANPKLEAAYTFSCMETPEQAEENPYADWECDFYVKLDRDLGENQIFLGGNYGSWGWIGFHNGTVALAANEEIPLLGSVTSNPWTYLDVAQNVGTFTCGVSDVNDSLKGATFTVMLRLTNPEDASEFYNIATINYTFN